MDAQRNHALLLAAAKHIFAERGPDAPLDEIARRAGVGNATMYRHFPTRGDMIIAVYADEVAALTATGETLLKKEPPGEALFTWLRAFIAHVADKRALALAIPEGGQGRLFNDWHAAMHGTAAALLARAQAAGQIRPDVDEGDLLALANGIALAGADLDRTERLLHLIRQGTDQPSGG